MDFLAFDSMLPFYIDYLGCFDRGIGGIDGPETAMKELIEHGVNEQRFVPGAELSFTKDQGPEI